MTWTRLLFCRFQSDPSVAITTKDFSTNEDFYKPITSASFFAKVQSLDTIKQKSLRQARDR